MAKQPSKNDTTWSKKGVGLEHFSPNPRPAPNQTGKPPVPTNQSKK